VKVRDNTNWHAHVFKNSTLTSYHCDSREYDEVGMNYVTIRRFDTRNAVRRERDVRGLADQQFQCHMEL
jgi:hypothetical protein